MKNVLIFLSGALVGVAGSLFYVKKYIIPDLKEDIEREVEEREQAANVADNYIPETDDEPEEEIISEKQPVVTERRNPRTGVEVVNVDYSKYSRGSEEPENSPSSPDVTETGGTEPYLIDAGSYDEYSDYRSHSFTMYSDGIVIDDETEDVLDADPELVFGKTAIEELKNSADRIVYIRDDSKKQDYSLELSDYPFNGPTEPYHSGDPDDWRD